MKCNQNKFLTLEVTVHSDSSSVDLGRICQGQRRAETFSAHFRAPPLGSTVQGMLAGLKHHMPGFLRFCRCQGGRLATISASPAFLNVRLFSFLFLKCNCIFLGVISAL